MTPMRQHMRVSRWNWIAWEWVEVTWPEKRTALVWDSGYTLKSAQRRCQRRKARFLRELAKLRRMNEIEKTGTWL